MRKVQISGGLLACLVTVVLHAAPVVYLPSPLSKITGQEAWLAVILAGLCGFVIGSLAIWVSARHPGLAPAQISRLVLGKWAGGLVGLLFAGLFTFLFSLVVRNVLDFSVMIVLPGTPGLVIAGLFVAVALYCAWSGLEPLARVSFQVLVAVVVAVAALPLLEAREFSIKQLDPFLNQGVPALLQATFIALSWFGESVFIMSLIPHLKNPRSVYRWFGVGIAGSTLLLTVLVAQTLLVFGSQLPGRFLFPVYYMLHLISIAKIIERIEVILVTIWTCGMFVKAVLYLLVAAEASAQSLGLRNHRWAAVAVTVVGLMLTQIWRSALDLIYWASTPGSVIFFLSFEVGIPVVLLVASVIRSAVRGQGSAHA